MTPAQSTRGAALSLQIETRRWPLREPFAISRGVQTEVDAIVVTLVDGDGRRGRGEACGVPYAGETPETMTAEIEAVRARLEQGLDRQTLLGVLPAGGARCAVDAALWDLEAKTSGRSAFLAAGVATARALVTAYTIGIRSIDAYETAARARANYPLLEIKVDGADPIAAVAAARRGAAHAAFIVDPNQSWSIDALKTFAPRMAELGVVLLEQPIKVGDEEGLDGYTCPVRLCADELINGPPDLAKVKGRFDVINIKLDKTGGLTAALDLASAARADGLDLMVGCMAGSSLAMAPAVVLGQHCSFVDLDGPLLQSTDWPDAMVYQDGVAMPPTPALWG
jgi:L-alanine-DL-glutamate epimerase-like enolase superfamily enzyme